MKCTIFYCNAKSLRSRLIGLHDLLYNHNFKFCVSVRPGLILSILMGCLTPMTCMMFIGMTLLAYILQVESVFLC